MPDESNRIPLIGEPAPTFEAETTVRCVDWFLCLKNCRPNKRALSLSASPASRRDPTHQVGRGAARSPTMVAPCRLPLINSVIALKYGYL